MNKSSTATHHTVKKSAARPRSEVHRPGAFLSNQSAPAETKTPELKTPEPKNDPKKIKITFSDQPQVEKTHQPQEAKSPAPARSIAITKFGEPAPAQLEQPAPKKAPEPKLAKAAPAPKPAPKAPAPIKKETPKQKKDKAVEAAIRSAEKALEKPAAESLLSDNASARPAKKRGRGGRLFLAVSASAAVVAALAALVVTNLPDLSVKVAAVQTGIEATYPSYIPRGYQLAGVSTSKNDRIIMEFIGPEDKAFALTEEKSTWDNDKLLREYVTPTWEEDFVTIREQGMTIFISGSDGVWLKNGILYKLISSQNNSFTKKQIKNIAFSL